MNRIFYIIIGVVIFSFFSCGKRIIRTYYTEEWGKRVYVLTSDTSGYCVIGVDVNSKKNTLYATLGYYSSYKTANEIIYLDYDIIANNSQLESYDEKYSADDSNYKLLVGTENTIKLKKDEEWKNLGTQLKIDTVKNEYLNFKINITKKYKIKGELPQNIIFSIHSKTTLGIKDISLNMYYNEFEDKSAPIRIH